MLKYGHLYYLLLLACEEQLKVRSWTATAAKSDKRANKKGEVITATTARWDISYPIRKFASKAIKWSHVILISCESGKKEEKNFYTRNVLCIDITLYHGNKAPPTLRCGIESQNTYTFPFQIE